MIREPAISQHKPITPEMETVPMTQVSEIHEKATATGECAECQWFGGHDTTCSKFVDEAVTLDGETGAPIEPTVNTTTVDGVEAVIKNITPEPQLPIPAPTVNDAIEALIRAQRTLEAATLVTTRAKSTQKTAQEAVDTAVLSVVEAYGESHTLPLPLTVMASMDEDPDDAPDDSNDVYEGDDDAE